jgi:hypothetical protein
MDRLRMFVPSEKEFGDGKKHVEARVQIVRLLAKLTSVKKSPGIRRQP